MTRFSIVIPVYRAESCLEDCLNSVRTQTFGDFEVILVDDGSDDRSGLLCDGWADRDSRFRVIHQENGGAAAARNRGMEAAAGEYVLFLDSDDCWAHSRVLEELDGWLGRKPVDALCFNFRKVTGGKTGPLYFSREAFWVSCPWNKAIRRECLSKVKFRVGVPAEDMDWALRLALTAETVAYCPVDGARYRQRPGSLSRRQTPDKVRGLLENVRECVRLLEASEKAEKYWPYAAYQYGVALHNAALAEVPPADLESLSWLLDRSHDPKLKLLRLSCRFLGMSATLALLRLRNRLREREEP